MLLAVACGVSVANVYYAQPLLDRIGRDLGLGAAGLGLVTTVTQGGYLLGLILMVPLGDLTNRRILIVAQSLAAAVALVVAGLARQPVLFFVAIGLVGVFSVVVQVIVAYAAVLSAPETRGRIVGIVTSGVVIGILLARTVSGLLADLFGWRSVYLVSAVLMTVLAVTLARLLPRDTAVRERPSYGQLAISVFMLTVRQRVFRVRSLITLFMFAASGALWGSMALPLSAAPWYLSTTQLGLFGVVGAVGALGAAKAGEWGDRGLGEWVSGIALVLLTLSWAPMVLTEHSLVPLVLGVLVLDLAGTAIHVTNQNMIVDLDPAAGSRLIGSYMVYYSIGEGGGALAATSVYDAWGWSAVCLLGAGLSAAALLVWAVDRLRHPAPATRSGSRERSPAVGAGSLNRSARPCRADQGPAA